MISGLDLLHPYLKSVSATNEKMSEKLVKICKGRIEMLKTLVEDFIDFTRFENEIGLNINKQMVDLRSLLKLIGKFSSTFIHRKVVEISMIITNAFL